MVLIFMQRKYSFTRDQINSYDKYEYLDSNQLDIEIEF